MIRFGIAEEKKFKSVMESLFCSSRCEGYSDSPPTKKLATEEIFASHLPFELITEIFEWLPIKFIAQFRCVSKSCYALFKTPEFIRNHRIKQGTRGTMLLLRRVYPPTRFYSLPPSVADDIFSFHDLDSPDLQVRPPIPTSVFKDLVGVHNSPNLSLVGSANGIVCILYNLRFIFSNPALHEFKLLPPCSLEPRQGFEICHLGAGFGVPSCCNNNSLEFKVIVMHTFVGPHPEIHWWWDKKLVVAHLYNSTTNSWRQVDDPPLQPCHHFTGDVIFLNGACHWSVNSFYCDRKMILSFDMTYEVFRQLELPDYLQGSDVDFPHPIVLNNCLGVVQYKKRYSVNDPVEIWVMKEYGIKESWIKQFVISPQSVSTIFLPWKDDTMLMVDEPIFHRENMVREATHLADARFNGQLKSITLQTNETKKFLVFGAQTTMRALIYEESLVSLK